jgi:hypothetical protein
VPILPGMSRSPHRGRSLRERLAAAWRDQDGAPRTQPIFVASVCSGVIGFTLARALHLNVVLSFVVTVIAVFVVTTVVLVRRTPR